MKTTQTTEGTDMKKLSEQLSDLSDRAKRTADVVDTAKANAIVARADADDLETT